MQDTDKHHYCSDENKESTKSKNGTFGHPEKCARDTGTFFKKVQSRGGKKGTNGATTLVGNDSVYVDESLPSSTNHQISIELYGVMPCNMIIF